MQDVLTSATPYFAEDDIQKIQEAWKAFAELTYALCVTPELTPRNAHKAGLLRERLRRFTHDGTNLAMVIGCAHYENQEETHA